MSERVVLGRVDGLVTPGTADRMWTSLTAHSSIPAAPAICPHLAVNVRAGYVMLGSSVVELVRAGDGQWSVPETDVRRAAGALNAVAMDRRDLIRIGPFHGEPEQKRTGGTLRRWRQRIIRELRERDHSEQPARHESGPRSHLAGIDWEQLLMEEPRDSTERTWWLPRAMVRLLDAAEHTETHWLQAVRTPQASTIDTAQPSHHRKPRTNDSPLTTADGSTAQLRPYKGELKGQLYSVLSRKPGMSRKVAGWTCTVCGTAPAAVLDHCHEHGYVRAPVCPSCNTLERPDHLYTNDIRVAGRYTRLFDTHTADWLPHWHRCPGCRTRTALPLPHLAAWTAHTACRQLRPTHPGARGRKPCGVLRASWTGSHNAPRSCLLTISVDFCPSGEHRVLARIPYREAAARFGAWLAETAPAVAAAAGPDRLDGLPAQPRPVIADTSQDGLALF